MTLGPLAWIVIPLIGGLIGYGTNRIAVAMLFRPIHPRRILGMRLQGLMPRRQADLAVSIGRVVGDHLVEKRDILDALQGIDLEEMVEGAIEKGLAAKVAELQRLPLVGTFLTEERVADLRAQMVKALMENREAILEQIEVAVEDGLDVERLVTEKVAAFPMQRLEQLILDVASRELRSIEVLGGVLGLLIGFAQMGLLTVLT